MIGRRVFGLLAGTVLALSGSLGHARPIARSAAGEGAVPAGPDRLWLDPIDLEARDLLAGPGGRGDVPQGAMTFIGEDLKGTSPKIDVRDEKGVKWRVKLGPEARPETVACRILWAVGYFATEDYFLPEVRIRDLPRHLHRGGRHVEPGGVVRNVRLKRHATGEKKVEHWRWDENPFSSSRELNGLRVMMALINDWDLTEVNNAVYERLEGPGSPEKIYLVSDLGATFGTAGHGIVAHHTKGNLKSYERSAFITRVRSGRVDFACPAAPTPFLFIRPHSLCTRLHMRWIGRHIPIEDARWIGRILARLSPQQIRDAFRAALYSPDEVEGFARVVERRIAELNGL